MFRCRGSMLVAVLLTAAKVADPGAAVTPPYFESFDSATTCSTDCDAACILTSGWTNVTGDDQDWLVDAEGTPSVSTGPSGDHTSGSGNYLYIETSSPCSDQVGTASLVSPPLELDGTTLPNARFWYHQLGSDIGELHVDVLDSSLEVLAVDVISPIANGDSDQWVQTEPVDLRPYIDQGTVHLRIRGIHSGTGFEGDQAIDDFEFTEAADLALTKIVDQEAPSEGDPVTFTLALTNTGPGDAGGVIVHDALPAGVTFQSATADTGDYDSGSGDWTVETLPATTSATLTLETTVTATEGSTVTNTAEVTASDRSDPDSTPDNQVPSEDDQDSASFTVTGPCGHPTDLLLQDEIVGTTETYTACNSIQAGNGFQIVSPGDVTFVAGSFVELDTGFTVEDGAAFTAEIDESLACAPDCPLFTLVALGESGGPIPDPGARNDEAERSVLATSAEKHALTLPLEVSTSCTVAKVEPSIEIHHRWIGDLSVALTSPDGTTVYLHNRNGGGRDRLTGTYGVELAPRGRGRLSDFVGRPGHGTWTLTVRDWAEGDRGRLETWALRLACRPPAENSSPTDSW